MVVKISATDANTAKTWDATKMNDEGVVDLDSYEFRDNFFDYIGGIWRDITSRSSNTIEEIMEALKKVGGERRDFTVAVLNVLKSDNLNNAEDAILKRVKVEYTNYKDKKFSRVFDEIASQKFLSEGVDFDDVKAGTDISVTATATQGENNRVIDSNIIDRFEDSVKYYMLGDFMRTLNYAHNSDIPANLKKYNAVMLYRLVMNYDNSYNTSKHLIAQRAGLLKSAGEPAENRFVTLTVTIDGGEDRIAGGRGVSQKPGDSVTVTVKSKGREPLPQASQLTN